MLAVSLLAGLVFSLAAGANRQQAGRGDRQQIQRERLIPA
jgi:hypothetical protein